jgi:peptidyl-prolyl cis-trans isomerase C
MPAGLVFSQTPELNESSLALVNEVVITRDDLDNELNIIKMHATTRRQPLDESALTQLKRQILESLINREVLYQQSIAKGIRVESFEVENQIEMIKQKLYSGKNLDDALAEIDMTKSDFEMHVKKAAAINKLLQDEVYGKVSVSDRESRIFYDNNPQYFKKPEQVRASHILINIDPDADDEQKAEAHARMEEIQTQIEMGGDFAALAKQFSEGPSSVKGGDLGYFDRKMMVKSFAEAAFALEPGQVSKIVETRFGLHIIKVMDRTPETKFAYVEIKDRLVEMLRSQKIKKETIAYIDGLKEKADIQRYFQ